MTGPLAAAAATAARPVVVAPPAAVAAGAVPRVLVVVVVPPAAVAAGVAPVVVPEVLAVLLATKRYIPSQGEERGNHLQTGRFQPNYLTTRHISTKFFCRLVSSRVNRQQDGAATTNCMIPCPRHTRNTKGGRGERDRETNKRERGGGKREAEARLSSWKSSKGGIRAQRPGFVVPFSPYNAMYIQYVRTMNRNTYLIRVPASTRLCVGFLSIR